MALGLKRRSWAAAFALIAVTAPTPGNAAYLFWYPPTFASAPVRGDEPGIAQPFPGATDKERRANLLWNMRSGLNVAALQCQFAPALMTVSNYNDLLRQHGKELASAYTAVTGYFKRTNKTDWQMKLDQYTTRTYQGFSTMHGQLGFCETASSIGREALSRPKGKLYLTAEGRMQQFRNSLAPNRDLLFAMRTIPAPRRLPPLQAECWDKKGGFKKKCAQALPAASAQLQLDSTALD